MPVTPASRSSSPSTTLTSTLVAGTRPASLLESIDIKEAVCVSLHPSASISQVGPTRNQSRREPSPSRLKGALCQSLIHDSHDGLEPIRHRRGYRLCLRQRIESRIVSSLLSTLAKNRHTDIRPTCIRDALCREATKAG